MNKKEVMIEPNASNFIYHLILLIIHIILNTIECSTSAAFERVEEEAKRVMNSCCFASFN